MSFTVHRSFLFLLLLLGNALVASEEFVDEGSSTDIDKIEDDNKDGVSNKLEINSNPVEMSSTPEIVLDKELETQVLKHESPEETEEHVEVEKIQEVEPETQKVGEMDEEVKPEAESVDVEQDKPDVGHEEMRLPYRTFRDALRRLRRFPLSFFSSSDTSSSGEKLGESPNIFLANGAAYQAGDKQVDDKESKDGKSTKVNCRLRDYTDNITTDNKVIIVNDTSLQTLLKNGRDSVDDDDSVDSLSPAVCQLLLLYAPWCRFSVEFTPQYNALARVYSHLELMAINAVTLNYWNARFGTVAVPNVLLFHHGKYIARFNGTERSLETLSWFIQNHTNLNYNGSVALIPSDFDGDLPVVYEPPTDIYLYIAWLVIVVALCRFLKFHTKLYNMYSNLFEPHPHLD